jgi:hypothetical protein
MVATFCLRLAFGMIASLVLLDPTPIPPRFFRVQYLVALALTAVAGYFLAEDTYRFLEVGWLIFVLVWNGLLCVAGSMVWHLRDAPVGRVLNCVAAVGMGLSLFIVEPFHDSLNWWHLIDHFVSGAVLGAAVSAMLLGHSYLISPTMTIVPLRRLLIALFVALALRVNLAFIGLWQWTAEHSLANLETETLLWLATRWLLGLIAPLVLGWMAWETARIRSTQSATGILYVVVIMCFLGELMSLLLLQKTGSIL